MNAIVHPESPDVGFSFDYFPELETERLILRELMPEDAEELLAALSDDKVTRYYELESCSTLAEVQELIDYFDESFEDERSIRWGIARKSDNRIIGSCGYAWLRRHRGEISYELTRVHWRKGYMSEALDAIIDFGFSQLGLNRIEALVMRANLPSAGLLKKLGFREEGTLRQHDFFKGEFHDMRMFALLERDTTA